MKKLKFSKAKKEYHGVAFLVDLIWLDSQIIIVAPTMGKLKRFYKTALFGALLQTECDPKLCRRVKVVREEG